MVGVCVNDVALVEINKYIGKHIGFLGLSRVGLKSVLVLFVMGAGSLCEQKKKELTGFDLCLCKY